MPYIHGTISDAKSQHENGRNGEKMRNQDIRDEIRDAGLRLWQVADELKIADYNLSRKLRHELTDEEKAKIRSIIDELRKEGKR